MSEKRRMTRDERAERLRALYDNVPRATLARWIALSNVRGRDALRGATRMRDLYRAARAELARVTAELEAERRRADEAERLALSFWDHSSPCDSETSYTPGEYACERECSAAERCKLAFAIRARREQKEQDRG